MQAAWSEDGYDDLDLSKAQILVLDFEWLGVGTVRVGFVIDGVVKYAHNFHQANLSAGVYMSTPNLPVRWELDNDGTGGAATLESICASVISEGGLEDTGFTRTVDRGATTLTTLNNANLYPLVAVRLKSTALNATARISDIGVLSGSAALIRWALLLNPSVSGTALSFTGVADSVIEAGVGTTNATTVTGGTLLASGYSLSTNQAGSSLQEAQTDYQLGSLIDGTADIIVLAAQRLTGTTVDLYATMSYIEQV